MAHKHTQEKRSPIKDGEKPLRNPGESLDREINRLFEEEIYPYIFVILAVLVLVIYEWLRWFFNPPPQPIPTTLVAVLVTCYCIYKMISFRSRVRSLQQGLEGEKTVGQFLENLRSQGCMVFHDIPGESFNIDDVIVSARGVFTVETKTLSKPIRGNPTISFDGDKILVDGHGLDRDPVPQGLAERKWLQDFLQKETGILFPVKAVIVFPGWFVEPQKNKKEEIWILNQKALPKFIENEPITIKNDNVHLIGARISDYVRKYNDSHNE